MFYFSLLSSYIIAEIVDQRLAYWDESLFISLAQHSYELLSPSYVGLAQGNQFLTAHARAVKQFTDKAVCKTLEARTKCAFIDELVRLRFLDSYRQAFG